VIAGPDKDAHRVFSGLMDQILFVTGHRCTFMHIRMVGLFAQMNGEAKAIESHDAAKLLCLLELHDS